MGWRMNLPADFGPQLPVQSTSCLGKVVGLNLSCRDNGSCIWPYIVGGCTGLVHYLAASTNQNVYRERLYRALHSYINSKRGHIGRAYTEGGSVV